MKNELNAQKVKYLANLPITGSSFFFPPMELIRPNIHNTNSAIHTTTQITGMKNSIAETMFRAMYATINTNDCFK